VAQVSVAGVGRYALACTLHAVGEDAGTRHEAVDRLRGAVLVVMGLHSCCCANCFLVH